MRIALSKPQVIILAVAGVGLLGVALWAIVEAVAAEPAVAGSIATAAVGVFAVVEFLDRAHKRFAEPDRVPTDETKQFLTEFKGKQLLLGPPDL